MYGCSVYNMRKEGKKISSGGGIPEKRRKKEPLVTEAIAMHVAMLATLIPNAI